MASKLNQVIAAEKGVKTRHNRAIDEGYKAIQKGGLFSGLSRTYTPKDEGGETYPSEQTKVQVKADELLKQVTNHFAELFDITATKDYANCEAKADVAVDGQLLLSQVPVTFLLFLEKQLTDVLTFIRKLPILDPADDWKLDENRGHYVTEPTKSNRTKKVPKTLVKAPATDKHPAQVDVYHEDIVVGEWSTTKFSSGLSQTRVDQLVDRSIKLLAAIKHAREEANMVEAPNQKVGESIFNYLLA